ncbi:MAG TPA: GNAT family N-acetyltransferase [Chthoniobacterales bacterium]
MLIRKAVEADVSKLLGLMRELACFEKYVDDFAITEEMLIEQGFRRSPPDFHCLVAEEDGTLVGMLVYYFVPFTYRAKPNVIVKELYIPEVARGRGIGSSLMKAVANEAVKGGSGAIKWYVADWNSRAIGFYERLGAKANRDWIEFEMSEGKFRQLASS